MGNDELITSAFRRSVKLGGLVGRVGASVAANRLASFARSDNKTRLRSTENLIKNATRVVETLGQLKGAAMKVGQMLSLHEGLLPAEVMTVLRSLQGQAPQVPPEVMRFEVEGALGEERFQQLFASFDEQAFAAASIGQVHHATLQDGRPVAVKVQYPLIDQVIRADLRNLRMLLQSLFALISEVDFGPIWQELRDRLLEELDYVSEAENIRLMAELHREVPEIVIPEVIGEASCRTVLTMARVQGIKPADACSDRYSQELRDRWGEVLMRLLLRSMLEHRVLHADPNLANFAFLEDGRVIVYDFGCVKRIPAHLARGYARLMLAVLEHRAEEVPGILLEMGVFHGDHKPVPIDLVQPYADLLAPLVRESPPYTFGEDEQLYDSLLELGLASWSRAIDIHFPQDIIFIDRTMAGHFGNLIRLHATAPWHQIILEYTSPHR